MVSVGDTGIFGPTPTPELENRGRVVVGWREWMSLPRLGIPAIKAKVDTGARTSSLHAFFTEHFRRGGKSLVRFGVHPLRERQDLAVICVCELLDQREVSDSGGYREKRWVIETPLRLGDAEWPVEVTLTNRDSMLFRMLLGCTAMVGRILVDPKASYLVGGQPDLGSLYSDSASHARNRNRPNENRHSLPQSEAVLHQTPGGGGDRARP